MDTAVFAVTAITAGIFAFLTGFYLWARAPFQNIEARLTRVSAILRDKTKGEGPPEQETAKRSALAELVTRRMRRRGFSINLARDMARADIKLTVGEYVLLMVALAILTFAIGLLLSNQILVAVATGVIGFLMPGRYVGFRRARRSNAFNNQLADTISLLTSGLRSGYSLMQAIENAGTESPSPTREELARVILEIKMGLTTEEALAHLAERIESPDIDLLVTAININREVGGNLSDMLDTIHETITERAKIKGEIRVLTGTVDMSSYVVGFMPIGIGLFLFLFNPKYMMQLFTPGPTLCLPIGGGLSLLTGFIIIRKIADIKM